MGDGIFYNQSVTSADLNDIAIDLGHSSFNGFGTEKFGAAELNKITRDLVGKGYLKVGNMCKPSVSSSGALTVQDGIVVFSDGAKRVFKSPVTFSSDCRGKVIYFKNETANGRALIYYHTSYPADGDYVPLCEVQADGTVIDKRVLAVAKVQLNAAEKNRTEDMEVTLNIDNDKSPCGTIPLSYTGYNGILARYIYRSGKWDTFSLKDKEKTFVTIPASGVSTECFSFQSTGVYFERTTTGLNYYGGTSWSSGSNTLKLKITLF